MKYYFSVIQIQLFLLLLLSTSVKGQQGADTIWFDGKWNEQKTKQGAEFYSLTTFDSKTSKYVTSDYYITGKIQMTMEKSSLDPEIKNGHGVWYHKNGVVSMKKSYNNNELHGEVTEYFLDGTLQSQGSFLNNKKSGLWKHYSSANKLQMEGNYKESKKVGTWNLYNLAGKLFSTKEYREGHLSSIYCFTCDSIPYYEYKVESKEGQNTVSVNFEVGDKNDYNIYKTYIQRNITLLLEHPFSNHFALGWNFVVTYASNAPGLNKLAHKVDKFTLDYLTYENKESQGVPVQLLLLLGLASHNMATAGQIFDDEEAKHAEVMFLLQGYENCKKTNPKIKITKLEKLIKKRDADKLRKFIKNF